ncbi:P-loop containing nucleoside triphosphate hydrolase protein [Mycena maculata]|uniref:P-loop containing nucleoside triphosphate hydrolase protein n=1 Tax=Mycena maculata TaxID=230809 RepID=A0AAD7K8Y1_9AGAR|nr:P-loop containing nucleoside triphosphate hydrolase protein [Mycena maculata]
MIKILKDIAIDTLPWDESPQLKAPLDYEGIDILAEAILAGMSNWLREIDPMDQALQPWYAGFREAVQLLRQPLSAALLPNYFSLATSGFLEKHLLTLCREVEFDVLVGSSTTTISPANASPGLYYVEHVDASDKESQPRVSASSGQAIHLSAPLETLITSGVSFENVEPTRQFTIAVLGGMGVGKTALICRLVFDVFIETYDPTIEDSYHHVTTVDGEASSLDVIDPSGCNVYRPLVRQCIKEAVGFLIAFSLASQNSLEEAETYREAIRRLKGPKSPIVVVGTNSDLVSEREVSATTIETLAKDWDLPFYETSVKKNWHANDPFEDLVRQMRQSRLEDLVRQPGDRQEKKKQQREECIMM